MLALSRKLGESIVINDDIVITVLDISKDQIKIGIEAPRSIPVYREEVYLQIQEENKAAMTANDKGVDDLKKFLK